MKVLWLTDLHLNQVDRSARKAFFDRLREGIYGVVAVTGDISVPRFLSLHLSQLAQACSPRRHFVNASTGGVIKCIGTHFPKTRITVLCGHAHHAASVQIALNFKVRVGQAYPRQPAIQDLIEV